MIRSIPTINTLRLSLGGMRPEDFDRFAEIWAIPDVVRHITGTPLGRGQAWESFLRNAGHWQMTGFGQWAITEHRSRQMIGQTGFFHRYRALGEDFDAHPEAGWVLHPDFQGYGYAFEAVVAAHDWFDRVIHGTLVALVASENTASLRLAESMGYKPLRSTVLEGDSVDLLRRDGPPGRR